MAKYKYPYSDFHELNLDYILKLCRESLGIALKVIGKELYLVNDLEEPISKVTISYATSALNDDNGRPIKTYILEAGVENKKLVFEDGDGNITYITVPYATQAEEDVHGNKIDSYVKQVGVAGDKLLITFGDGHTYSFNCPYAVKASQDVNHKDIVTYAAGIETDGNEIVLTDGRGLEITRIICQYAEKAKNDVDGDEIKKTYAHSLVAGTTTVKLIAKDGTQLSEITVPYATHAREDINGNEFLDFYGSNLVVDGQRIGLESPDGNRLDTITVPFATLSTDATNAVERAEIIGDQLVFTTYGGQSFSLTCPYAIKAKNDGLNNEIVKTYVANVTNNSETGEITFYDATGAVIVSLIPTVDKATHDSYNNVIADYVKTILVDVDSDYVTVIHGNGEAESLKINFATHAWQDSNGNVIKNTYIKRLACEEDVVDGHYKLVAYNGDAPEAELFRIELVAYRAQEADHALLADRAIGDVDGDPIVDTYGHSLSVDASTNRMSLLSKSGEVLNIVDLPKSFGSAIFPVKHNIAGPFMPDQVEVIATRITIEVYSEGNYLVDGSMKTGLLFSKTVYNPTPETIPQGSFKTIFGYDTFGYSFGSDKITVKITAQLPKCYFSAGVGMMFENPVLKTYNDLFIPQVLYGYERNLDPVNFSYLNNVGPNRDEMITSVRPESYSFRLTVKESYHYSSGNTPTLYFPVYGSTTTYPLTEMIRSGSLAILK